jgi:hypothetical protein
MTRARLMIVCGLPGAGKTTVATELERRHDAVRLSADDWMQALAINLWDEQTRARIEALQWRLAQQLLVRAVPVVIEWGTWSRSERDALRLRARELGAAVERAMSRRRSMCCSIAFSAARWKIRRLRASSLLSGAGGLRSRRPTSWRCTTKSRAALRALWPS